MTSQPTSTPLHLSDWHRVDALTGDASPRRYSRLVRPDGQTAILVEYPPSIRNQLAGDLEVFSWCRRRGLRVPEILARDLPAGRALLEDLGIDDAEATLERTPAACRRNLVEEMLRPLEILAGCGPDELPRWNPPLDRTRLRWELAGFELWFVRHYRSQAPSPSLARWLDDLAAEIASHPRRVCHRDYHLNNLLIQRDGTVGIIDIQDILVGPDTYDAVSLVAERAATRLLATTDRRDILASWAQRTRAEPGWPERAAAVRIQRGLKVLGTFARFTLAGRTEYRRWLIDLAGGLVEPLEDRGADPGTLALVKGVAASGSDAAPPPVPGAT
jgi:aminoglycoside/choline kinase family phosphotransferase